MTKEIPYCGPDNSPKWVKKFLSGEVSPGGSLNPACKIHDADYAKKGKSKSKSDLKFLGNSLRATWYNPLGWVKSFVFYLAVAIGGKSAYKEAQK